MPVEETYLPIHVPVDDSLLGRVFDVFREPMDEQGEVLGPRRWLFIMSARDIRGSVRR